LALDDSEAAEAVYRDIVTAADERLDIPIYYVKSLLGLARTLDGQGRGEEAIAFYKEFLAHWGASEPLPGVEEAKKRLTELGASQ
jgi:hypothetical protein